MLTLDIEGLIGGTVDFLSSTLGSLLDFLSGGSALLLASVSGLLAGL